MTPPWLNDLDFGVSACSECDWTTHADGKALYRAWREHLREVHPINPKEPTTTTP